MTDKNILQQIVAGGEIAPDDFILEIGAGEGVLTCELSKASKNVLSLEIDQRLFKILEEKFSASSNVKIKNEDALKLDPQSLPESYKIISNIPYNITSKILEKFLTASNQPTLIVLLVQKELAERVCAGEGDKSFLSVLVQYFGEPKILKVVSRFSFSPPPQVESAILKINNITRRLKESDEKIFFQLVKIGFSQKRKMLKKNLKSFLDEKVILSGFKEARIDLNARAEEISLEKWLILAKNVFKKE
ncbi:MAG: ribosomal RNA small subunit methyltransferase A [Candidatus Magasanikbacteria bacterium RIFOXYB2_FULL_38_10]|nr:MAG: ribosomal RNA small subunit methyltransferase A [Candidatus Magasanikbacteria bacterium RIFOXYB2_FULL_38_10]